MHGRRRPAAAWYRRNACSAHVAGSHFETGTHRRGRNVCGRGVKAACKEYRNAAMNLAIVGYGKMGRLIEQLAPEFGFDVKLRLDVDNNTEFQGLTTENFR